MKKKSVLITGIGNNDPYTSDEKLNNTEVGPGLSLIAKYMPEYLILFVTEKIRVENRFELFKLSITEIYRYKNHTLPEFIEIFLSDDEEYSYQKTLQKVVRELKPALSKLKSLPDNFTYVFSKTSATPQLKNALEIFPRLFLEDNYKIITKKRLSSSELPEKPLKIELFTGEKIIAALFDDTKLKADIAKTIKPVENELTEQKFYGLLESFKYLIKSYEYSAALEILNQILKYDNHLETLNITKKALENHRKLLGIVIDLLGFQLPTKTSSQPSPYNDLLQSKYLDEIPSIKSFLSELLGNPKKVTVDLAYENIPIFREKALSKEFVLGFLILFERLRKNDLIRSLQEHKLENEIKLGKDEKIYLLGENFKNFLKKSDCEEFLSLEVKDFKDREKLRKRLLADSQPPDKQESKPELKIPILALAFDYLVFKGINNASINFYAELVQNKELYSEYKNLTRLRDRLAHDFISIDSSHLTSRLLEKIRSNFNLDTRINFYKSVNSFILKSMLGLC